MVLFEELLTLDTAVCHLPSVDVCTRESQSPSIQVGDIVLVDALGEVSCVAR
jgi:hypothetical protein